MRWRTKVESHEDKNSTEHSHSQSSDSMESESASSELPSTSAPASASASERATGRDMSALSSAASTEPSATTSISSMPSRGTSAAMNSSLSDSSSHSSLNQLPILSLAASASTSTSAYDVQTQSQLKAQSDGQSNVNSISLSSAGRTGNNSSQSQSSTGSGNGSGNSSSQGGADSDASGISPSSNALLDKHHHQHKDNDADVTDDDYDDEDDDDDYDDDDEDDDIEVEDDDPGQDHAVPDDPNSSIIWSPQNQQSTCEFTHTITNYSQKRESGCKKAEYSNTTIDPSGNRWRLIVYVNGNGRASNHHLSLFLQVADADDLPFGWKKAVSYVLTLEHPNGPSLGYAKRNPDKTFKLCPKAIDWGWSQFITSDRIQQDGYISDDSLTVRASVTVKSSSISIDPEDAELYLKCAVEEGNAEAVEACLAQGASVNCQFKDDLYTPLHTACSSSASNGSLDVLNLLLKRGADGNACNKWRETPLLIAANNGHKAAVEALLKSGADPSMCSEAGWSALTFAAHKGYDEIVTLLLTAGAPVNCRVIEDMSTPLHKACAGNKEGHLSAVKQLLTGTADVHALNKWRETPLLTAANHGQAAAVEALLDAGADPCRCTDTGWSPLSIAAYKGHDDVVELLLDQGAPTEEADPTLSALLQAATKGLPNTVELLLRNGADHTVTTKKGDTALSILVEQNLIDAAVEMVTEYKASVSRCSRDRKKVQRARLLINLRMKQQKLEDDYNDDSDQDESDEGSRSALHDSEASSQKRLPVHSKKKKKGKKSMSAEEKAKAAEEALLLELEQEDAKAQKDEAAATSKRNKKKKRKERERQQKLEQEKARKEKEEKEAKERESQRRMKEEQGRKAREAKAREQREREMKEAVERQKKAAARQKEKEQKEKKRREKERLEQEKQEKERMEVEKRDREKKDKERHEEEKRARERASKQKALPKKPETLSSKPPTVRGWETSSLAGSTGTHDSSLPIHDGNETMRGTVEDQFDNLANMANDIVGFLGFDATKTSGTPGSLITEVSNDTIDQSSLAMHSQQVEPSSVSLFRHQKVTELLQFPTATSQSPLASIDSRVVQTVIYKWIIRASYEAVPFLDPIIPSWADKGRLVEFLQRQLISEGRKMSSGISSNIEMMKEAGTYLAERCLSLAQEIVDFRKKCNEVYAENSDSAQHMDLSEEVNATDGSRIVAIASSGNSKIYFSHATFNHLNQSYTGPSKSILTSMFSLKMRYDTLNTILFGTDLDCQISLGTLDSLVRELKVTTELWSDPLSVFGKNSFCGIFSDIDTLFGGYRPFIEQNNAMETILVKEGGSAVVLPSADSTTASFVTKRILNILERTSMTGVPVSFTLLLPMRDLSGPPSLKDLSLLDSRLLQSHQQFIRHFEPLPPGQHCFQYGGSSGQIKACNTGSIMLILQNDSGRFHYPLSEHSIAVIMRSLSMNSFMTGKDGFQPFGPESIHNAVPSSMPSSPIDPRQTIQSFGDTGRGSNGARRGRFFDLEDNGEDDFTNADAMVSGMMKNLNISMFQGDQPQEVDIEEVCFTGIVKPTKDMNSGRQTGRFG